MAGRPLDLDHAAMGLAHALAQHVGAPVALAVKAKWDGTPKTLFAAASSARTHKGHSAVVNLIQGAKQRNVSTLNLWIYSTEEPTYADKGMFITQIHGTSVLNYL